jgi:hypothetical protein
MPSEPVIPQIGLTLQAGVQKWFFDRPGVQRMMLASTREALNRAGALVRAIARRSMRYATAKAGLVMGQEWHLGPPASAPGTPPHAVQPHPWIREFLYYAYDPARRSVVVGPMRLNSKINVPAVHEFGGRVQVWNRRRRVRRIGKAGEIRIGGRPCRSTKPARALTGETVMVTYAKLRTAAQAGRANDLNRQLYGPAAYMADYPPRPFMGPALAAAAPSLPKLWATSVKVA